MLVSLEVKKAFSIIQILVYDKALGKLGIIGNHKSHRLVNSFPRSMLRGLVCMHRRRYGVSMRVITLDVSFPSLNWTVVTKKDWNRKRLFRHWICSSPVHHWGMCRISRKKLWCIFIWPAEHIRDLIHIFLFFLIKKKYTCILISGA